ncbi:hypothetical protein [Candidatus Sororendozoicomonas aggregata]|uniref:hypothetical protein n=1 Tax=Candidatus Sororendozoicomonas aggregata TaxID=3073239 RepID=UPI002ED60157
MSINSSSVLGGAVATGISLNNSATARSLSDATVAQVMEGTFHVYMSDILAVVGVVGLVVNICLNVRRDRRQQRHADQNNKH